jgi:hypothetical protein
LGGGYFGGFISTTADGVATHALIVGPVASAQSSTTIQYKNANTATAGADSDIDGPQNTADMVADGNATVYPAAHFCNDLVIDGFSDWYMPAKNELEVCYYTLKPTTAANDTSAGINPNAVPARASNYTSSGPTQTAATNFQNTGAEDFGENWYWSSTESSATQARLQYFGDGLQAVANKNTSYQLVRAIRRIAIADASLDPYRVTGKGGAVWIKGRSVAEPSVVVDTARGASNALRTSSTAASINDASRVSAFTASGFIIGSNGETSSNGQTFASWTFREQAKFFDVQTFTAPSSGVVTVNHNLGSVPGCIILKILDGAGSWFVYHRALSDPLNQTLALNTTGAVASQPGYWTSVGSTSVQLTVGTALTAGFSYVMYLWAHDAGGFGLTGTDNVVSCGSFTADGSGGCSVTLGYEPQWIMYKNTASDGWRMGDVMRGWSQTQWQYLAPNDANVETSLNNNPSYLSPTATGFNTPTPGLFTAGNTFVYVAIRRGPMRVPTVGTSVFEPQLYTGTATTLNVTGPTNAFQYDSLIQKGRSGDLSNYAGNGTWVSKLQKMSTSEGGESRFCGPAVALAETAGGIGWYKNDGFQITGGSLNLSGTPYVNYWLRRAPGFFDVVCYTGNGSTQTINHNLGVAPELIIGRNRTGSNWSVNFNFASTTQSYAFLNLTDAGGNVSYASAGVFSAAPTATQMFLIASGSMNGSGQGIVAYLFATCPGVSKVGSYTGNAGNTVTVPCGFTAGVRFVLIKRTDDTGDWYVWDSARGIVAGNDPYLLLNSTAAEVTGTDYVDTYAAGFEVTSTAPAGLNATGGTYIFLAIA